MDAHAADHWFLCQDEPARSSLLCLRDMILSCDNEVTLAWKYRMPFFLYKGKMFCYLWIEPRTSRPYLGIVEGHRFQQPELVQQKRARMKIWIFDPHKDLPVRKIKQLLKQMLHLYKSGLVKVK